MKTLLKMAASALLLATAPAAAATLILSFFGKDAARRKSVIARFIRSIQFSSLKSKWTIVVESLERKRA